MQNKTNVPEDETCAQMIKRELQAENKRRVAEFVLSVAKLSDASLDAIIDHVMTLPVKSQSLFVERCSTLLQGLAARYSTKSN